MNNTTSGLVPTTNHNSLPLAAILSIAFVAYVLLVIVVLIVRSTLKKGGNQCCQSCCQCEKPECCCDTGKVCVNPFSGCCQCDNICHSQCLENCSCFHDWSCPITCCQGPMPQCHLCDRSTFSCRSPDCSIIDCCCFEIRMKNGRQTSSRFTA